MKSRVARKVLIARRIFQLRRSLEVDKEQMRLKTISQLGQLFEMASSFARGEQRWQVVDGKPEPVKMKQRKMWARVAAYIAQIVTAVTERYDVREVDRELDELERLVNEAGAKNKVSGAEEERLSQ